MTHQDTIVALATPSGAGAIAVIRISGEQAIAIALFKKQVKTMTLFFNL